MAQVTELLAVPQPVVFGFLRTYGRSARTIALTAVMGEYCERHELALHAVVSEPPQGGDTFAEMLVSMSRAAAYGVIVPSRSHLGVTSIATTRRDAIARARLRLIIIRMPVSTTKDARRLVREVDGNDVRIMRAVTIPPPMPAHRSAYPGALSQPEPETKRSVERNGGSRHAAP